MKPAPGSDLHAVVAEFVSFVQSQNELQRLGEHSGDLWFGVFTNEGETS